ncbi:hypothetical protein R80B4_01116 [Fibrobacteres bacterium R8-0-B4]
MAKSRLKAIATAAVFLSAVTAVVTIGIRQDEILPGSPVASDEIRVHYIDVGQGDAVLIQSSDNAVLIDGGDAKTQKKFIAYLRSTGITSIDYVVATHPHTDHIGGLPSAVALFEVKDVLMLDSAYPSPSFNQLITVMKAKGVKYAMPSVGDTFAAGIIRFTVLAPAPKKFSDLNDMSIVVRMVYGETAFLFTGDAEGLSEREMLKGGLTLRSDVLKVGHHGSKSSTTSEFLNAVHPSVAVISCGKKNTYGLPDKEVLARIMMPERNITLYRTDEDGTVVISTDGRRITLPRKKEVSHVFHNRSYRKQYRGIDKHKYAGDIGTAQGRIARRREGRLVAVK